MSDPRIQKLAQVLVRYSVGVKKGDWVRIEGSCLSAELVRCAMVEVLKAGGYPTLKIGISGTAHAFYHHASDKQIAFVSPSERVEIDKVDCRLALWGGWNSKEMTGINPKRLALASQARKPLFDKMLERIASGKLRWCGTLHPTHSSAQDAEMSLEEYEDFVYKAGMLDKKNPIAEWRKVSRRQAKLAKRLNKLSIIRIVGRDTDISFNVKGRKWVNCDGRQNFPDGEVFTGPHEESTEGHIRYAFPAVYGGREVENVRLWFKKGKVVEAKADKGQEYLKAMLEMDPGACRVGELAFGTNYSIKRFTKNTLFDEKIGGTMHIAVGAGLPESGSKNKSALHWDMVCDTRKGFTVYGNGKPIMKNGRFAKGWF